MQACELDDRLLCDALEFEGRPPPAATGAGGGGSWQPSRAELALAWSLVPLLLLGLASRLFKRRASAADPVAHIVRQRSRHLAPAGPSRPTSSGLGQDKPQQQRQKPPADAGFTAQPHLQPPLQQQQPLPPHPATAFAGSGAGAGGGTGGSSTWATPRGSSLLAAADETLSSLLVLPISLLQHARYLAGGSGSGSGGPGGAAAPPTPHTAGPAGPSGLHAGGSSSGGSRGIGGVTYGLGLGEAESEEEEWGSEGGESELTQAALRRLQQSAEFRAYMKERGLAPGDVALSARRLRLYRRLRQLDPHSFWHLLRPGSRAVYQSRAPSPAVLATDYLLSTAGNLAAAAAAYALYSSASPGSSAAAALPALAAVPSAVKAALTAAGMWLVAARWLQARPTMGALFGLWYEESRWGHAAPAWRCLAANLAELLYLAGSLGLGVLVSLYLRCFSKRRQSVGELLAAVHAVQEVRLASPGGEEDEEEEDEGDE